MKNFVTIFEKTENIHLIKDVGQIPYIMHKKFGYDATIVTVKNEKIYDYLEDEVKGLKMRFIPKVKFGSISLSVIWYLLFHAKNIDVLHLFHHRERTYVYFWVYKLLNPSGVAYLKSDMGYKGLINHNGLLPKGRLKYKLRSWLFYKVIDKINIISIETKNSYDFLVSHYPQYKEKFLYLSNALNIERFYALSPLKKYEEKENIVLTVGRIGAPEKDNQMLLDAVEKLDLEGWKVLFVGPIEPAFQKNIEAFYDKNPNLRGSVEFIGPIYERQKLFDLYSRSKIFCLTSVEESFGFVLIEAMAYGNYIVTTPISSAKDLTADEKVGEIISDADALSKTLEKRMKCEMERESEEAVRYAQANFDWTIVLKKLDQRING